MINNRGFTLIEFLIAILILMVGLLGMLQGINLAMNKSMENVFRNEATMVADDLMMAKRTKQFESISTTIANPAWTSLPSGKRFTRGVYKNYSVQQIINSKTNQTKEVVINVSWNHRNKRNTHSVSSFVSTTVSQ
jgi:type IV pilus assembly protein PilV